jgi:UPF0716 protein FxsA
LRIGKQIAMGLIALPVAEFAAFVVVAMLIGLGAAFGLMILTSLAGVMVLRYVGRGGIAQFRVAVTDRGVAGPGAQGAGVLVALGGILLVLPGFITDVAGALLLLPWVRRQLGATIRRATSASGGGSAGDGVVDLAPDEWHQVGVGESARARSAKTRDRLDRDRLEKR